MSLFLFPGAVRRKQAADFQFTPLVYTGPDTGAVKATDILMPSFFI